MSAKWDYEALEQEYIEGPDDLTPRKMAERDGASFAAYYAQFRKRDWARKRAEYREKLHVKTVEKLTDTVAMKVVQMRADALDVIHAAFFKMAADIQDRWVTDPETGARVFVPGVKVTPDGLAKLLDRFQALTGNPTTISENRNLGIDLTAQQLPPDVARALADLAGERGTQSGPVGRAALPSPRTARTN